MKNLKFVIGLIIVLFTTGCTVNYDVEIYKDTVKVNGIILEEDSSKWSEKIFGVSYSKMIDLKLSGDEDNPTLEGLSKIDDERGLGLEYKNKFKLYKNYETSPGIKACYDHFRVAKNDKTTVIATSIKNTCFDNYPNLDKIVINLKTNHKVVSSNADESHGYHYTWNITKGNKDDAVVIIEIKNKDYIFNYENEIVKKVLTIGIIIGIILGVIGAVYLYFRNKSRKADTI